MLLTKLFSKNKIFLKNNLFKNFSKIVQIKLPDLGEGTKEATIKKWYKKEGEKVEEV
jgi:hypothetical protein